MARKGKPFAMKLKMGEGDELYNPKYTDPVINVWRVNGLQMNSFSVNIKEVKQMYQNATPEKKKEKIAMYSLCSFQECSCKGWKPIESYMFNETDLKSSCNVCSHPMETHVSHLEDCSHEVINNLLSVVIDLECLSGIVDQKKGDETTLHIYNCVCKVLRKSVHQPTKPEFGPVLEKPPFELVTIDMALRSFVLFEFSSLKSENDFQFKYKCAQILLHFFDSFKLLDMTDFRKHFPDGDVDAYKIEYARWMCYCVLPKYFDSLQYSGFVGTFGFSVLKSIFTYFKEVICSKIYAEKMAANVTEEISRMFETLTEELEKDWSPDWLTLDAPTNNHLVPLQIIPKTYQALQHELVVNDRRKSGKKMCGTPSNLLDGALPSAGPDLPDGVPEDVVIEAMHILTEPCYIYGPRDIWDDGPRDSFPWESGKEGALEVHFVANSVTSEMGEKCKIYLISLQNLFYSLLPEIDKKQVTKFIFDTKHRNLVLVSNEEVIGGICFRMFPEQNFSEIVFCGVSEDKQTRGFGAQMMNHLKDYHIKHNVLHFLTHADLSAVPYFKKQGFSKRISLKRQMYLRFIKEYDGSELLECRLDPKIRYVHFSNVLKVQKEIVKFLIRKERESDSFERPEFTYFSHIPDESILSASGCLKTDGMNKKDYSLLQLHFESKLRKVLDQISSHTCSWPFQTVLKKCIYPEYYKVIKKPIDLERIRDKLNRHYYTSSGRFHDDIQLMFQNCRNFHENSSPSYKCACVLEEFYLLKMREFVL